MSRRRHAPFANAALLLILTALPAFQERVATAAPSAESSPAADRRLRQELGFRADDSFIRSLHDRKRAGHDVHDDVLAIPITDDEYRELLVRDELGRQDATAVRAAFADRSDFAGLYVDNATRGRLVVLTTGDPRAVVPLLMPRLRHPDRLDVRQAAHTIRDLTAAKTAVDRQVERLRTQGVEVSGLGIDQPRNTVVVSVVALTENSRRAVVAAAPEGAAVDVVEAPFDTLLGGNFQDSLPFRGGQSIRNSTMGTMAPSYNCSIGFVGFQTLSSGAKDPAVITAGHCGDSGTAWYQYSQMVGISGANTFPREGGGATYADAMRIPISQGVSNDFLGNNGQAYNISGWEGQYEGAVGQTVCNNGAASIRVCGTLMRDDYTSYQVARDGSLVRIDYLRVTTATALPRDSGGAVTHTAGAHYASGIAQSANCPDSPSPSNPCTAMKYTHIYNALRALHLTGVYTQ